jgi:2-polyprenyl-6-methoxyphenol hydroxylase-like FAD-dependent oxidoreductase
VTRKTPRVVIIGAGTGGLCLAHGLRSNGMDVKIFERDQTPEDRLQGYRLNISATGNRALAACLPTENYRRFVAASARSSTGVGFFDQNVKRLLCIEVPKLDRAALDSERPVSRIALRKVLLDGVEDLVAFGRTFTAYENGESGEVIARFEGGSAVHCDLLVGADGAGSRVARQLLPHARRIDTGLVVVSGRFPLDEEARRETPEAVFRGPTLIMGPAGVFMFASAVEYLPEAEHVYDTDEYVMWGISARREDFDLHGAPDDLDAATAQALALRRMEGWAPALRRMVERADPNFTTAFAIKTASEVAPWQTRNVTLLGDALHNMTPFRGMGANAALYDASALKEALVRVSECDGDLVRELAGYERDMIDHGFAAVRASLTNMERFHAKSPLKRLTTKTMFRLVDAVPSLQGMFRGRR